jgi:hypothetical protein
VSIRPKEKHKTITFELTDDEVDGALWVVEISLAFAIEYRTGAFCGTTICLVAPTSLLGEGLTVVVHVSPECHIYMVALEQLFQNFTEFQSKSTTTVRSVHRAVT